MGFSGHTARKRFGQHWLIDAAVLNSIVEAAKLQATDRVLEIGPGRGALTEKILEQPLQRLEAIELDRDLVVGLQQRFGKDPRFNLHQGDALAMALPTANKVVANIPYNITGPLLEILLGRLDQPRLNGFDSLVLLLQQEVAQRITAAPGSSSFSALSVRLQLQCFCEKVCEVPPRCFQPPPKVNSEVICLRPLAEPLQLNIAITVEKLLKSAFAARRKMLRNTLCQFVPEGELQNWLNQADVSAQQRPQEIGPNKWVALATALLAEF